MKINRAREVGNTILLDKLCADNYDLICRVIFRNLPSCAHSTKCLRYSQSERKLTVLKDYSIIQVRKAQDSVYTSQSGLARVYRIRKCKQELKD